MVWDGRMVLRGGTRAALRREQADTTRSAFVGIGLGIKDQPARPVSMTRLNALNVGFLAFVALFLVWAIFFFR